jgi:hypothetical protein
VTGPAQAQAAGQQTEQIAQPGQGGTARTGDGTAKAKAKAKDDGPAEESHGRPAVLRQLASNARLGSYFSSLTVRDGAVHAIKERQIIPAC